MTRKTTLLKLVMAEEVPKRGRVLFQEKEICKIKKTRLPFLRRCMGAVFQDYKLLCKKTVYENVAFALEVVGAEEEEIVANVPKVLEIVGLQRKSDNFPEELSAGERQRTAIARALIHRPKVILADEPTGNLDPYNTSEIVDLFKRINGLGTTVVLATHNEGLLRKLKNRVIFLEKGKIIRDDDKKTFIM